MPALWSIYPFCRHPAVLWNALRCIAWDMRLHGSTEDDGLPFTYWEAARDALAILDWGVDGVRPGDRAVPNRCTSIAAAWPWHRSNAVVLMLL